MLNTDPVSNRTIGTLRQVLSMNAGGNEDLQTDDGDAHEKKTKQNTNMTHYVCVSL